MTLKKDALKQRMQANSPTIIPAPAVPLTDLTGTKPNVANAPNANLNVPKLKGRKDAVTRTKRYSFEITHKLERDLEQALVNYRKETGKNISKSEVIRDAIEKHLKRGKL